MTLAWAIKVISKEMKMQLETPELDAATEVRQACVELEEVFSVRGMKTKRVSHGWERRQKSTDDWSMAFMEKHG